MSSTASNYDVPRLFFGQAVAGITLSLGLGAAFPTISISLRSTAPLLGISLLYGIMMFASSYVEEEQHFWYWTTTAWLTLLWIKWSVALSSSESKLTLLSSRKQTLNARLLALISVSILIATRVARRWNQTGQKFAGEPDIAKTFFFEHKLFLWILVGITYLSNLQSLASRGFPRFAQVAAGAIATALATAALTFKLAFTNEDSPELMASFAKSVADNESGVSLVLRARILFIALGLVLVYTIISGFSHKRPNRSFSFSPSKNPLTQLATMRTLHDLLSLLLITQSRATNIPLLLIFEIQFYLINDLDLSLIEITTTSLLLQHTSFFIFGGSNAISSIDLSSAYNGVSGYNVLAVGVLTFVSNWSGPIFWTSATNLMLLRLKQKGEKEVLKKHLSLLTVFVTASLAFVMAACTLLRTHLFIWTVFSPKYLYSMAWSLGQHLGVNVVCGSFLFWLGTKYI
jgi:ethanolaminephosphotransferase